MKKLILFFMLILFFSGCSESKNGSLSDKNITGILIDSIVSGVEYSCPSFNNVTSIEGYFSCPVNSSVTFSIGGVTLGNLILNAGEDLQYITPAKLYGLSNYNITDIRVLNFIQFIQSLDNDNNTTNGINITSSIRESLAGSSLNISNKDTTQNDLNTTLNSIGKNLISQNIALEHYINTLQNDLNVTLKSEPYYYQQWYLDKNNTFYNQNNIEVNASIHSGKLLKSYTGKGIKIAIIDDGLDITHEDLKGAIINTYDISTKSTNVSHTSFNGHHGTAVTGIIGARVNGKGIQGIASQSQIIFLKYKTNMSDSETISLFNKAQEFGADIINCSWGTYDVSQSVKDKIIDLANNGRGGKGTIIVFACGNDDQDMGNDESSIPEVISVGATDKDNLRVWYSNYGVNLDVMAPGGYDIGITTIDPMDSVGVASIDNKYLLYNDSNSFIGTSASTPIVSGLIALILEKNPNLTRIEIENLLTSTSDKIGNLQYENGRNNYYGYGKINLTNIMKAMK